MAVRRHRKKIPRRKLGSCSISQIQYGLQKIFEHFSNSLMALLQVKVVLYTFIPSSRKTLFKQPYIPLCESHIDFIGLNLTHSQCAWLYFPNLFNFLPPFQKFESPDIAPLWADWRSYDTPWIFLLRHPFLSMKLSIIRALWLVRCDFNQKYCLHDVMRKSHLANGPYTNLIISYFKFIYT